MYIEKPCSGLMTNPNDHCKEVALRTVIFTGGGSAGHCVPLLPIIERCLNAEAKVIYVGSEHGIERDLCFDSRFKHLPLTYQAITTTKLRRQLTLKNLAIPFLLLFGIVQSLAIVVRHKPTLVYSKGGFVTVPIVIAAKLLGVKVICHESDLSIGLANKIGALLADEVHCVFPPSHYKNYVSARYLKKYKQVGLPIRDAFHRPPAIDLLEHLGIPAANKPVLLVFGGGLGSMSINQAIWRDIDDFCNAFTVIHLTGQGHLSPDGSYLDKHHDNYFPFEYIKDEMPDLIQRADYVVCRAGMTAVIELLHCRKLATLVPLPLTASRGDQIENAEFLASEGLFSVLHDNELTFEAVHRNFAKAVDDKDEIEAVMTGLKIDVSGDEIYRVIVGA